MVTKYARFYSLEWVVSDVVYQKSDKPPNKALKNRKSGEYVKGSEGTFVTKEPNKLILTLQTEEGEKFSENIYSHFRDVFPRKNCTKTVRKRLEEFFKDKTFEVRMYPPKKDFFIFGVYDAIREALK